MENAPANPGSSLCSRNSSDSDIETVSNYSLVDINSTVSKKTLRVEIYTIMNNVPIESILRSSSKKIIGLEPDRGKENWRKA